LYRLARIYWNRDDNLKALDLFKQLKKRYPRSAFIDFADLASARIYESLDRPDDALRIYQEFSKRFPDSQLREEAAWRSAWIHYLRADYSRAHTTFKHLAANKEGERYKTAALYWQARTAERTGRSEEAKQIFLQIVNGQEDSYYMGPAARRLEGMGLVVEGKKTANPTLSTEPMSPLSPDRSFHLSRAQELAQISLSHLAVAELDEIKNLSSRDLPLKLVLIREYARNKAYARSVALATQIHHPSDELNRHRYPLAYWEMTQKMAEERGLDPYLVLGLIRQESRFDPKALSPSSAFGLMQLLPSTAARVATRIGLPPHKAENLFDPDLNLTLGTHYLKELLKRYSNNPVKAIAAYNAGENAVARWERQISAEDEEEFIERIPYGETRLYVKLVLRNYRIYRKIYDSQR
ncbi:MAG: tetratricopeptide repeat protein, partial [Candidatus Binatia bacterium]